jgi:cation diffusion facilitator CzcD-associated flavoprotein CzcO
MPSSVVVIGGGAAGLAALHQLLRAGLEATLLEKCNHIGGIWKNSVESQQIYDSLVTNLPKEIMAFDRNNPFTSSFAASSFCRYLEEYALNNCLMCSITLERNVLDVRKTYHPDFCRRVREVFYENSKDKTMICDAVVVCNGHYNKTNYPKIPGRDFFLGNIMHFQQYKHPQFMSRRKVLIVGVKSSGAELAREILGVASIMHVSNRNHTDACVKSDNGIYVHSAISHFSEDGHVVFVTGETIDVDIIVMCTGFQYDFPFLKGVLSEEAEVPANGGAGLHDVC